MFVKYDALLPVYLYVFVMGHLLQTAALYVNALMAGLGNPELTLLGLEKPDNDKDIPGMLNLLCSKGPRASFTNW